MAKQIKPLSATQISKAKPKEKEYSLGDGDGLLLRIKPNGTKSWLFNYTHPVTKKRKNLGLGSFPEISLASAREKTRGMRQLVAEGIDPKTFRDNKIIEAKIAIATTLKSTAEEWLEVKKDDITSDYAEDVWRSLVLHVFPNLGQMPISSLTAPIVIQVLKPLEAKGTLETLKRVCQRLNEIMVYAVNSGKLTANPLANISQVFKKPKVEHMKTIDPGELNILMQKMSLANIKHVTRCAFEFQLHTLVRPCECAQAEWTEIDWEEKLWIIPEEKMKMTRAHKVPLTEATLQLLEFMKPISHGKKYIFPSDKNPDDHMNSQSVNAALKRAGMAGQLVSHGLRSIGSTALNEQMFNKDAIEVSLSHVDKNAIRDTYNRAEYLDERRNIMSWWSNFINDSAKNAYTIASIKM